MTRAPLSLLVVDDQEDNRIIFQTILEHAGHDVFLATNGREAVHIATLAPPDLIVMDLAMPVMDGWHAAAILKARAPTAHLPILAVSASDPDSCVQRLRNAGFCGFLHKPVHPSRLLAAVAQCLADAARGVFWTELPQEIGPPVP